MKNPVKSKEYTMLEDYISHGAIKTFGSKKDAQTFADSIGWKQRIVRVERRFEKIWIVGMVTQPSSIAGLSFDVLRCPTGQYETKNGVQHMVVVEVKKYIKKTA